MSLEASTANPMYTTELYKSVNVNETSVTVSEDSSEANLEVRDVAANESGAEQMEFAEDWSQKWILIENSS